MCLFQRGLQSDACRCATIETLRRNYISDGSVFSQTAQAIIKSPNSKRQDRFPIDVIGESHLLWPVSFTLATLAGKACCNPSNFFRAFARLCWLCVLEEGNCVATSNYKPHAESHQQHLALCMERHLRTVAIIIEVTNRHTDYSRMPAAALHRNHWQLRVIKRFFN